MTTKIWNGSNGNFADPASWSPTGVPVSGDTAIINSGTVALGSDPSGVALQLNEASGSAASSTVTLNGVTLDPSVTLAVNNQNAYGGAAPIIGVSAASGFAGTASFSGSKTQFTIPAGASLTNSGMLYFYGSSPVISGGGTLVNSNLISILNPAQVLQIPMFGDAITGTGTIALGMNGRAEFSAPVAATQTVLFVNGSTGNEVVQLDQPGSFAAAINGFSSSDAIAVTNTPFTNATYTSTGPSSGTLKLFNVGMLEGSLSFDGQYTLADFSFTFAVLGAAGSNLQITTDVNNDQSGGLPPATINPFAALGVSAGGPVTVTARLLNPVAGSFGNLGGGSIGADGQTYSVTSAQAQAAVQGVTFAPSSASPALNLAAQIGPGAGALLDTGAGNNVLTAAAAGDTVAAGSGNDTLVAGAGGTVLVAGSGPDILLGNATGASTLIGGAGGDVFLGLGGPTLIAGGTGHDIVSAASGNATVISGTAGSLISVGAGAALVNGNGRDTVIAGSGGGIIGVADNSVVSLGTGAAVVTAGNNDSVVGGAGADTVGLRTGGGVLFAGSGPSTFIGAGGNSTVVGGSGSETVFGEGGGGLLMGGSAGRNIIVGGTGATTVIGGGDGDVLFAEGSAGTVMRAGGGSTTLQDLFSSGNDTLFTGGSGQTLVGLGSGNDAVFLRGGSNTVIDGTGRDILALKQGDAGGSTTVYAFKPGVDTISLQGYAPTEAANAQITTVSGSTVVTLSDNSTITFAGVGSVPAHLFG